MKNSPNEASGEQGGACNMSNRIVALCVHELPAPDPIYCLDDICYKLSRLKSVPDVLVTGMWSSPVKPLATPSPVAPDKP